MSKPSSSQRVYYLIHFPLICLPDVFFTTINHTTWINSKLGVLHREALNCHVVAPIIASLPWPDPTPPQTRCKRPIHSYWCLIHVQKPLTWSMIIINPPLSLYVEWKAWIPPFALLSLQHLFCKLITYHLWSLTLDQLWTNLATMPEGGSDGPSLHLPDLLNSNHTTPDMFTYFSNSRESRN